MVTNMTNNEPNREPKIVTLVLDEGCAMSQHIDTLCIVAPDRMGDSRKLWLGREQVLSLSDDISTRWASSNRSDEPIVAPVNPGVYIQTRASRALDLAAELIELAEDLDECAPDATRVLH